MFLVAVLAVAGVAGILAAVYYSVRSGRRGGKRFRPAGAGRAGADRAAGRVGAARRPTGRIGGPVRSGQTEFALRASGPARAAAGSRAATGSRPAAAPAGSLTESWPAAPSDPDDPQAVDAWPGDSAEGPDSDVSRDPKPRRRVGFRKGADIDEELWPAESFGGVSDEQFWDDLASDKPLTTTARTAQPEPGPRSGLLGAPPAAGRPGAQAPGAGRNRADQGRADHDRADHDRADQSRADGRPGRRRADQGREAGEGRRSAGYGAYPGPRTAAEPTAERAVVQPAYAATQPVKSMTPPPGATQPVRAASGTGPTGVMGQPRGTSAQPAQPAQPAKPAQPAQSAETGRRRRSSSTDEDPLTSSSFSLRSRGPVDGRSSLRPQDQPDASRGHSDPAGGAAPGPAAPYGPATPYRPAVTSYDDASSATQMMSTPPYGEDYGYPGGRQADQADQPRRANGARSHARPDGPGGTGERPRPPRPAYPQDTRPPSGSYPAGAYSGNGYSGNGHSGNGHQGHGYPPGGYQGSGYQGSGQPDGAQPGGSYQGGDRPGSGSRGNGHRAPYDPRDDYRRLTHRP